MTSFFKVNECEVHSDSDLIIKYNKDRLTYKEGKHYLYLPIEHLSNPYEILIYIPSPLMWIIDGVSDSFLSEPEVNVLTERIKEALNFLGRNYSFK